MQVIKVKHDVLKFNLVFVACGENMAVISPAATYMFTDSLGEGELEEIVSNWLEYQTYISMEDSDFWTPESTEKERLGSLTELTLTDI